MCARDCGAICCKKRSLFDVLIVAAIVTVPSLPVHWIHNPSSRLYVIDVFICSFVCMCTHMCMCECIPVPASTHLYVCERERLHFFLSSHTVKSKRRLNERKTEFHDYAIQLLVCSGCVCCCWFELVYKRSSLALDISVLSDSRFTLHTIINSCLHWKNRFLV